MTHFVYELWSGRRCVYVGVTSNLRNRMANHRVNTMQACPAHGATTRVVLHHFQTRADAECFEWDRIGQLRPVRNRRGNTRLYGPNREHPTAPDSWIHFMRLRALEEAFDAPTTFEPGMSRVAMKRAALRMVALEAGAA